MTIQLWQIAAGGLLLIGAVYAFGGNSNGNQTTNTSAGGINTTSGTKSGSNNNAVYSYNAAAGTGIIQMTSTTSTGTTVTNLPLTFTGNQGVANLGDGFIQGTTNGAITVVANGTPSTLNPSGTYVFGGW